MLRKLVRLGGAVAVAFVGLVLVEAWTPSAGAGLDQLPSGALVDPVIAPPANAHDVSTSTVVFIRYTEDISPPTVSRRTFAVHAMHTGLLPGTYGVDGGLIQMTPTQPFRPGEFVQVSATTGTLNLAGMGPLSPTVWQFWTVVGGGSGTFYESGQVFSQSTTLAVAVGDVDGDGDLDVLTGHSDVVRVWLNDGTGGFADNGQWLDGGGEVGALALGDLDGDGDLDAFVAYDTGSVFNKVWLNNGGGVFTDTGQLLGNAESVDVALGDVDGDGDLDALVGNLRSHPGAANELWLNDGTGHFIDSGQSVGSESQGVAFGDLDNDRDLDLIAGNYNEPNRVWLNDGTGQFSMTDSLLGTASNYDLALGDLDDDGDLDAFIAIDGPNQVWLNDGTGAFTTTRQGLGNAFSLDVALGDLDGDGDLDAFVVNNAQPNEIWLNDGDGNFTGNGQSLGNEHSWAVALGDLDGDGDLDAFVGDGSKEPDAVWLNGEFLQLNVTASAYVLSKPQPVTYTYALANVSAITLSHVQVSDAQSGTVGVFDYLVPHRMVTLTQVYTISTITPNPVEAVADSPYGVVTATDGVTVILWAIPPCSPTIQSVRSGYWEDANTWDQARAPSITDVVKIQVGHTVTLTRYRANVRALCNYGVLQSGRTRVHPQGRGWVYDLALEADEFIQNYGQMAACDGTARDPFSIWGYEASLRSNLIYNRGEIRGGNGVPVNPYDTNRSNRGGDVAILGPNVINEGIIRGGNGGSPSPNVRVQCGASSRGGSVSVGSGYHQRGMIVNAGSILGGDGGDGNPHAQHPQAGGNGGNVNLVSSDVYLEDGEVRGGKGGKGSHGGKDGRDGIVWIDPYAVSASGVGLRVTGGDVIIAGGEGQGLDLRGLSHDVISATGDITLAVGSGGVVDLRGNAARVLRAGGRVLIASDAILLDPDVSLTDVAGSNVAAIPSQILYNVLLLGPGMAVAQPGSQVPIVVTVLNSGPLTDTYVMTYTDAAGWPITTSPLTLTIGGLGKRDVVLTVTVPMVPVTSTDTVTCTVISQKVPGLVARAQIELVLEARVYLPLVTRNR